MTTRRIITRDEVVAKLLEVDRDRSNAMIHVQSVYTDNQGNHCLVGEVLTMLGVEVPKAGVNNTKRFRALANGFFAERGVRFSADAFFLLDRVQDHADDGAPWGQVIEARELLS